MHDREGYDEKARRWVKDYAYEGNVTDKERLVVEIVRYDVD